MALNLSYDQLNNEYSMLMGVLGASVSKHLLDGHMTCVWANDYFYDLIGYSKSAFASRFHNRADEYFHNNPEGWRQLVQTVEEALRTGEKGATVYLRQLSPGGAPFWVKLQMAFMDEYVDGYRVAYTTMTDVTEMMQVRQEQERARRAVEKMVSEQDMLMSALRVSISKHLVDDHFTCIWANDYYYQLIGYPKQKYEALFHNHPDEYYRNNPEGWTLLTKKVQSTLEQGKDKYEAIIPMKYEDGSSYWVKLYNYFTDEYLGGYRTSYTVMTDVTELVQMRSEQELLMRAMKVSVSRHMVDEHLTVVWANDFYYELIGYSKSAYEALFHNHCDEYFQNNRESLHKIFKKIDDMCAAGQRSYEVFLPLRLPNGPTRWVKMVGFFTDEYQDGIQLAYTTMVDVTELMQIQQEKTVAYDSIPGFIVKHRILADTIIMIDASEGITELFDIDMERLPAFDAYSILQPESREMIRENHACFRRGEPFSGTIRTTDKYGRDRWFRIQCTCIDAIADDPVYLTVFIDVTDVTELRELQRKLEERTRLLNVALEEAKRANAAKSDFLSRMSHDIRTPMNAIVGMTEIAGAHLDEPQRMRDCLQKIRLSSHHLLSLINDVLDMSKIENGSFPINMAPVSLPEALREVIMITLSNVRPRRQEFKVHLVALRQEQFLCDALRLRQILLNLLSNAGKFTPEGGCIVFRVEQPDGEDALRFTVSDNGAGMQPSFLEHIFDAFTRERDSRTDRIEGSGLGMAITKRLVDLLGGAISVESAPGEGTVFRVTLPMRAVPAQAAGPAVPRARVLLVDADPVVLQYGGQSLEALGADAACTDSMAAAAGLVEARRGTEREFTLVILDHALVRPGGLEAFRQGAGTGRGRPLLILSAYERSEIAGAASASGADGFIEKPLFRSTLRECMLKYLAGKRCPERAAAAYNFKGKIFLLAEDNEINREVAVELLGSLGATLECAVNGAEAVRLFSESGPGHYALILMDVQMPVMSGYEAARAIRALPRADARNVPILAMTADAFVEDIRSAKEAGMNGHIAKPIDYETLANEISGYLAP